MFQGGKKAKALSDWFSQTTTNTVTYLLLQFNYNYFHYW